MATSIEENYSDYVTSELLQEWQADPQSAPGRVVSSPWPDRIDILRTEMGDKNQYTIYGEVIEVTSVELANGGAATKRPVTLAVQKVNDRWLIGGVTIGEYAQRGPVVYQNTRYGFPFYLPETWKGYTIVEEQWEGTSGAGIVETGPQLLIRHPDWTQKDPRQDIPIMVFTLEQWNALQKGDFFVSAAPIGPSKLGGNSVYVFALPARYNYAFQTGFEEVAEILNGNPLWPSYYSRKKVTIEISPIPAPVEIKPLPTIEKASPEFMEWARPMKEESQKPVTGLFDTELDIKQEDSGVKLDFSLQNISEEDLKLNFDMGREFNFFVANNEGEEVYRWSHGKEIYLPAIALRLGNNTST